MPVAASTPPSARNSAVATAIGRQRRAAVATAAVRNGTAPQLVDPDTKVVREALLEPQPGLELIRYELPGHAAPEAFPAHEPRTRETFVVLEGSVLVTSGDQDVELDAADAAVLPGDREHRLRNPGPERARLLLLIARTRATDREGGGPHARPESRPPLLQPLDQVGTWR